MDLPTSPTDAVAKAGRAISSALLGSDPEPIVEEVEENSMTETRILLPPPDLLSNYQLMYQVTPAQGPAVWELNQAWAAVMSPLKIRGPVAVTSGGRSVPDAPTGGAGEAEDTVGLLTYWTWNLLTMKVSLLLVSVPVRLKPPSVSKIPRLRC